MYVNIFSGAAAFIYTKDTTYTQVPLYHSPIDHDIIFSVQWQRQLMKDNPHLIFTAFHNLLMGALRFAFIVTMLYLM